MKTWILILGLLIIAMAITNVILGIIAATQLNTKDNNKQASKDLYKERNLIIVISIITAIILILTVALMVVGFSGINKVTAACANGGLPATYTVVPGGASGAVAV